MLYITINEALEKLMFNKMLRSRLELLKPSLRKVAAKAQSKQKENFESLIKTSTIKN